MFAAISEQFWFHLKKTSIFHCQNKSIYTLILRHLAMYPEKWPNCRPIPFKAIKVDIYYNHKLIKLYTVKGSVAILCELGEIFKHYG